MRVHSLAQTVVRTTEGDSKAFNVNIGLHQGSVLSSLLFVIVMELFPESPYVVTSASEI